MRARWPFLVVALLLAGAWWRVRIAHSQVMPAGQHVAISPSEMKWVDPPPQFRKGMKMAVLYGEPDKAGGQYILLARLPAGYHVMPHWHPMDENVTVLSGAFAVGMGDTFDAHAKPLPAGSFFSMPAGMHHYGIAPTEALLQITGIGPFKLTYVNPEDDPSKQRATR